MVRRRLGCSTCPKLSSKKLREVAERCSAERFLLDGKCFQLRHAPQPQRADVVTEQSPVVRVVGEVGHQLGLEHRLVARAGNGVVRTSGAVASGSVAQDVQRLVERRLHDVTKRPSFKGNCGCRFGKFGTVLWV